MKIHNPDIEGNIEFVETTTSRVDNNAIFLDSSDNSLKQKNNLGEVSPL